MQKTFMIKYEGEARVHYRNQRARYSKRFQKGDTDQVTESVAKECYDSALMARQRGAPVQWSTDWKPPTPPAEKPTPKPTTRPARPAAPSEE